LKLRVGPRRRTRRKARSPAVTVHLEQRQILLADAELLAGSQAFKDEVPSIQLFLVNLRKGLKERGILVPDGDFLKLTQDYTFDSPSTAAGVMGGRSLNGRELWQDEQGRTLKASQQAAVGQVSV
jgi:hypothetical protein